METTANSHRFSPPTGPWHSDGLPQAYVHLIALWAFSVVQPILDLLGKNAVFLVSHRLNGGEILALVLLLSFGPPTALIGLEALLRSRSENLRRRFHSSCMGILLALATLPLLSRAADLGRVGLPAYIMVLSVGSAILYTRWKPFRFFLTLLAPSSLVFVGYFLAATPVANLVLPSNIDTSSVGEPRPDRVPVVLIVLDELPVASLMTEDGEIDARRLPNFGELASRSTWYRNATAIHPGTRFSVPSILAGTRKTSDLPITSEYPNNLFEILNDSHSVDAWEVITNLCSGECGQYASVERSQRSSRYLTVLDDLSIIYLHSILPPTWRSPLPPIDQQWSHFRAAEQPRSPSTDNRGEGISIDADTDDSEFQEWKEEDLGSDQVSRLESFIDGFRSTTQPGFHYLHLALPHQPFQFMPSGKQYVWEPNLGSEGENARMWGSSEYLVTQMQQRHLLQLGYVDALLGQVLEALEEQKLLDPALVIVTADHGISFQLEAPKRLLVRSNAAEIVGVPLFIKLPGMSEGKIDDRNVELVDIAPTVADVLGIEGAWKFDGRSLLDGAQLERDQKLPMWSWHNRNLELPEDLRREVMSAVKQRVKRFPQQRGDHELYAFGRYGLLIGQRVEDREVRTSMLSATLDHPEDYWVVDRDQDVWPSRLLGRLEVGMEAERPVQLAVSVNGVLSAVGETYADANSSGNISMIIPDERFWIGDNDVRLYELVEIDGTTVLNEITTGRSR